MVVEQHIFHYRVSQMFSLLLQLHGKLRVILEPLIGDVPLVGAVTMFFIRRPVSFPQDLYIFGIILVNILRNNQNVVLEVM